MAELTVFGYLPGNSRIHRLDVRFKLLCLVMLSLSILQTGFSGAGLLFCLLCLTIIRIRLSPAAVFREIRYFFVLLLFIFISRALSTPGHVFREFAGIRLTYEGLLDGTLVCARLLVIVLLGLCLVATTRTADIRAAVVRLLKPVPFIPEKRVGTMLGLMIRFIPVILNQARETAEAQKARGIENRKNPVYRLTRMVIPLMRRIFSDADHLVTAMEARCYSEDRTPPDFSVSRKDWMALMGTGIVCGFLIFAG